MREVAEDSIYRPWPTTKDEEWKYTDLRELVASSFSTDLAPAKVASLQGHDLGLEDATRIVFVNGLYREDLTSSLQVEGVEIRTLQCVANDPSDKLTHFFGKVLADTGNLLAQRNTAKFENGVYVRVTRGQRVEAPIHIVFIGANATESNPRVLIVAEEGSESTIVESYSSVDDCTSFVNAVVEVHVSQNAKLEHIKTQLCNNNSFHIATTSVKQERDSSYSHYDLTLGGKLTRNDLNVFLNGENTHTRMDGVYVQNGTQHCDHHTRLDHAKPNCNSFEVYKAVLDDEASGVFNGKIFVYEDAQKTDAKQTNQSLLLSPRAQINTKPQLEIFADDVKCTHGATIGQLRADAMFYLRSRGIHQDDARALLVYAFAAEVVERISHKGLRITLEEHISRKLERAS